MLNVFWWDQARVEKNFRCSKSLLVINFNDVSVWQLVLPVFFVKWVFIALNIILEVLTYGAHLLLESSNMLRVVLHIDSRLIK